jgi:hypothetical protein
MHQYRYNSAMNKPLLRVAFYTSGEHKPVRDWLLKLEPRQRKEIGADIQAVQWRWPVSKPLVDGLGGGLYRRKGVRTCFADLVVRFWGLVLKVEFRRGGHAL